MKRNAILTNRNKRRENRKWLFEQTRNPKTDRLFMFEGLGATFFQSKSMLFTTNETDYYSLYGMFDEKTIKQKFFLVKKEMNFLLWEKLNSILSSDKVKNTK